jgi:hypothetical protein
MSASPTTATVAGASAADARKLISYGWTVNDAGLWSNGVTDPCDVQVALKVAETLAKVPRPPVQVANWWTHLAGSLPGTAGMGLLTGIAAAIVANPPPEMGLTPTAITWVKWGLAIAGAVLVGGQIPSSMKAVSSRPAPVSNDTSRG